MTLYLSNRDGNGKTNEEGHYKLPVNAWSGNVLTSTACAVSQQSPLALGVKVAPGEFKILDTSGNYSFTGWNSADVNVSISTADPANPRISSIVLYVDKGAATSASPPNNPGIVKLMSVNGTPAAVPSAPNGATIQSAVGAGNPYIVLANATVAAAGTQVTNANISDQRVVMTVLTNMVNTAALQDSSVSTAKVQDSAIATAKIADLAATTRKLKPTYTSASGNNGASRQTFPGANTTYTIVGSTINYTSGPTAELLQIKGHAMCQFTVGGSQVFLTVGGTQIGRSFYTAYTDWISRWVEGWYEIPANTSITVDMRARTAGTGGGTVCNASGDMTGTPNFGIQMYLIAWGKA